METQACLLVAMETQACLLVAMETQACLLVAMETQACLLVAMETQEGYFLVGGKGGIFPPLTAVFPTFRLAVIIVHYTFQKIIHLDLCSSFSLGVVIILPYSRKI